MKKKFKLIMKNKKFIFSLVVILMLIGLFLHINNSLYAATNPEYYSAPSNFQKWINDFFSKILDKSVGVLGKPFAALVNLVNIILFIVLYSVFVASGISDGLKFPFPDQVIFNGLPMLDPNFINPNGDSGSMVNIMKDIVQNFYYSFFALAGTVFVLAAVVIGIKLAFSALASEKARYKEAIKNWIMGLGMLFLMHFVLAGMFAINEQICISASIICKKVTFGVNKLELIPWAGSFIKGMINGVGSIFGNDQVAEEVFDMHIQGYGGLILKFAVKGILQNDLIYSIGLAIMLGQTFTLIIMYIKRVFYCIILGMIAPLIVAMDTIQKVVTGRDSGVLKNWFQNMVAIIFNQSFQAIFLCVTTILLGEIAKGKNRDIVVGLVSVIGLNAIMKFDKLFKELLGIKDSKVMGGLNENAMRSFAAIKSGMSLAKRSAEPFKKRGEAQRRYNAAARKKAKILNNLSELGTGSSNSNGIGGVSSGTNLSTNNINNNNNISGGNSGGAFGKGTASESAMISAMEKLSRSLDNNTAAKSLGESDKIADKRKKLKDELEDVETEMAKAKADQRAESLRAFTRFGTTLGSVGFGVGATDNFGDAVSVGNLVDMPMDRISDRTVDRGVYGNAARRYSGKEDAIKAEYVKRGMSEGDATELAKSVVASSTAQLNEQIPESIGNMVGNITTEAIKGAADVIDRQGKKYSKTVQKKLYSSNKIDDI